MRLWVRQIREFRFAMNTSYNFIESALCLLLLIGGVPGWQLDITPHHAHGRVGSNVIVLCRSEHALSGCQFKVRHAHRDGDLIDLSNVHSRMSSDDFDISFLDHHELQAQYHGRGLRLGDCGMLVADMREGSYVVGCRARRGIGGWQYNTTTLQINNFEPLSLKIFPSYRIINPGITLPVLCKTEGPMSACTVETNFDKYTIDAMSLVDGECRVAIPRIGIESNGLVWCRTKMGNTRQDSRAMVLIVAKPPPSALLEVTATHLAEGDILQANCTVRDSRPVATITWTLGDTVLRSDTDNDFEEDTWSWPWDLQSVKQTMNIVVGADRDGAELKCLAYHAASRQMRQDSVVLSVDRRGRPVAPMRPNYKRPTVSRPFAQPLRPGPPDVLHDSPTHLQSPKCGRPITPQVMTRISGGEETTVTKYPWSVVVYKVAYDGYQLVCGGTLLSPRYVLSSAQCFFDEIYKRVNNKTHYKLAVGKYHAAYDVRDDGEQRRDIKEITLHPRYEGKNNRYHYDISVLQLSRDVEFNSYANAICADWSYDYTDYDSRPFFVQGDVGIITGYGISESGSLSDTLRHVSLPWVDLNTCLSVLPRERHVFYTHDKFCAGYVNTNMSVCPGDSGGGLVFLNATDHAYYIGGVASISFKPFASYSACFTDVYTGFTHFGKHTQWVKEIIGA